MAKAQTNFHERAIPIGRLHGRTVYRIPVRVKLNDSRSDLAETLGTIREELHRVTAFTPALAANFVRDLYATRAETEIFAYGPQGGETYRYVGWDTATWAAISSGFGRKQDRLPFDTAEVSGV
jgi:hypothetical protein